MDKKDLLAYLQTQHLMAIATAGDAPWASTVFFVADEALNLYFVSDPSSNHGIVDVPRRMREELLALVTDWFSKTL